MRIRSAAVALCAALLIAAAAWLFSPSTPDAAPRSNRPEVDTTHEKIFLAEQLKQNPTHAPILLRLAQIERSEGSLVEARRHLENALVADPRQVDLRLELGLVCSEMGDFAAAEEQNRAIIRQDPNQPDALYNLGALAANRGDFVEARRRWTDALSTEAAPKARSALARLEGEKQ